MVDRSRLLQYPSDEFPAPPRFVLTIPEAWIVEEMIDVLFVLTPPSQLGGFRTNLTVTMERIPADADWSIVTDRALKELASSYPDLRVVDQDAEGISGLSALVRTVEFTVPEPLTPLRQVQALLECPLRRTDASLRDVLAISGTCPATEIDQYERTFLGIARSTRVE